MRVLLVNTSERTGGAAIACNRLMSALKKNGVTAQMMVRDKQTDRITVIPVRSKFLSTWRFLWERFVIFVANRMKRKGIFFVDIANTGTDITRMRDFKRADIIHLHWINQGFLSLKNLEKIFMSGKPVVITMHDMWYFTGICHYAVDCQKYMTECKHCEQLGDGNAVLDLARRVYNQKKAIYSQQHLTFVGCSRWITDLAIKSSLTQGHTVVHVPNALDMDVFRPMDRTALRKKYGYGEDRKVILFGAQRVTDERKGLRYLSESLQLLKKQNPQLAAITDIMVVGKASEGLKDQIPFDIRPVSYVSEQQQMAELYNVADIYVTPSLQDNLPNTIAESMACGTPCIGFNVGGIPEMIDHKENGYVAELRNAEDFANGIEWVLTTDYDKLSEAAHRKAVETYSEEVIATRYLEVYDNARNRYL